MTPGEAAKGGSTTAGEFVDMPDDLRLAFVNGALDVMEAAYGIRCAVPVDTWRVQESILLQVQIGRLKRGDDFTASLVKTLRDVGCPVR